MKTIPLSFIFSCLISFTYAQDANEMLLQSAFRDLQSSTMHEQLPYYTFNKGKKGNVKGSALLDESWQEGVILSLADKLYKAKLRYDAMQDEVDVWTEESTKVLPPEMVKGVRIGEQVFISYPFIPRKKEEVRSGFMEVLVEGEASLFVRHYAQEVPEYTVYPTQGKVPTGDVEIVHKQEYYYAVKNRPAAILKTNRGSVMDALSRHRKAVARYAKENGLSPKKQIDLIAMFRYYNEKSEAAKRPK